MQLPDSVQERLCHLACSYPLARVQFRLPDACDFYVYVTEVSKNYKVISEFGQTDNPELTLEMENSTLSAILDGQLSGRHAFLLGDVQYSGNRELAAALAGLFPANSEEGDR
ncbi:SCP2 sterol-binding domain-containing protein [Microbulbifer sp. EKSA008]|uniref:SCP2 sterol-binding domain-containing protein n=1 Tax=unclassified Microbulbifer TaxID=2619833 RepID=UPI0024AE0F9E|nr:SCP2 sterol-binding domain-containing protein [Microbulbifer sp. VAAF005]WHI47845.1 SCP2 sterol-binding domain-containing protein [Microbulbifer sp. VAAF005]WNZ57924.1 SCP2 sterol-binding domain-containing protein [Microbulbifer sp. MKSA007]